jgi:hypothetical protein
MCVVLSWCGLQSDSKRVPGARYSLRDGLLFDRKKRPCSIRVRRRGRAKLRLTFENGHITQEAADLNPHHLMINRQ